MSKPKIALVIGNGFSMSYGHYTSLAKKWNTQSPLSWDIKTPHKQSQLIDQLPRLSKIRSYYHSLQDFDIFAKTLDYACCKNLNLDPMITPLEARHYLTIAFSYYATEQRKLLSKNKSWPWYKWLYSHISNISSCFSLNYDLLIEDVLDELNKEYYSLQVNHHGYGIPLVKPHGSVDFEIHPNSIFYSPTYPLTNYVDLNDTPIIRLNRDNLIYPRSQALCIIPNESNKYENYQWVKPANEWFFNTLQQCTHCIFIGISYFECDKPELDKIIDHLPNSTQIIIANPCPPEKFIEKISDRPYMLWQSYDGPVFDNGNLLYLKDIKTGSKLKNCFCGSGLSYQYCCGAALL